MIGLTTDMVCLMPYNPEWKTEFLKEKELLLNILRNQNIIIEHVGSTSIEGCPAKPVIDIFIGVENLDYANMLVPIMQANGYINKFNVPNEVYFKKVINGLTTHHIHIAEIKGEVWQSQILFRDYMRKHPEKLEEYIQLKTMLAAKYPKDRDSYSKGKKKFIEEVIYEASIEFNRKRKINYE